MINWQEKNKRMVNDMKWKKFNDWYLEKYLDYTIPVIGWAILIGVVLLSPILGINLNAPATPMTFVYLGLWVFYMIGLPLLLALIELLFNKDGK